MNLQTIEKNLTLEFQQSINKQKISDQKIISIEKLTGDASSRSYFRLKTNKNSYVICHDLSLSQQSDPRVILLQGTLGHHGVRVPRFYDVELSQHYILQEDLGDQTLLRQLATINNVDEEYHMLEKAIDHLVKIHSIDTQLYLQACFTKEAFDQDKLMWEVNFTVKNFLGQYLKYQLSSDEERVIGESFEGLCRQLAAGPRLLCHRDFHARNIMVCGDELVLIDFQDARMGLPQYDLVSLLEDCYYRYHPTNTQKIRYYYWEKFLKNKKYFNKQEDYEHTYDLMAIQRIFKAIGSFAFFATEKQNPRYLKYIGHSFENLKFFLLKDKEWDELRKLLCRIYYAH
ncbi:MAG: phosphotransferase [Pseudomonadota bacterium]